ncbi:MAG TPA: type II toxin-antitoxin system VapC family toxin [Pseudolysinimonas sp.]|nr:type II toxin-antitoxin system VapC family toxin [Pseudolysinimonas sp.]
MTTERGLIDTNVVIRLTHIDGSSLPRVPAISTVTLAELSVGPLVSANPREQAKRQQHLQLAESVFVAIPLDANVARAYGRVAADLRAAGRKASARAFDALIAATALAHELPLYTANPDDFVGISGLDVRTVREAST